MIIIVETGENWRVLKFLDAKKWLWLIYYQSKPHLASFFCYLSGYFSILVRSLKWRNVLMERWVVGDYAEGHLVGNNSFNPTQLLRKPVTFAKTFNGLKIEISLILLRALKSHIRLKRKSKDVRRSNSELFFKPRPA